MKQISLPQGTVIEVLGNVASGKTTLAKKISHITHAVYLDIDRYITNPFLAQTKHDSERWALTTGLCFSFERSKQIERLVQMKKKDSVVLDSGFDMGIEIYTKDHFINHEMTEDEWNLLVHVHQTLMKYAPLPDLTIIFSIPPLVLLERILKRGRPHEKAYTEEYVERLHIRLQEMTENFLTHKKRKSGIIYAPYEKEKIRTFGKLPFYASTIMELLW